MRKCLLILLLIGLVVQPSALAAELAAEGTMARKAQRGTLNVALSPLEISHQIMIENQKGKVEPTWFFGGIRGAFFAVGRAFIGVYEIVTAPWETHPNNRPALEPEFAWEHLKTSEIQS